MQLSEGTRMQDSTDIIAEPQYEKLMQIELEMALLTANWSYCDRISSYVAQMVSHNRTDSLFYANLFSSALNELLETVFRQNDGMGSLRCTVYRQGHIDRIELLLAASGETAAFYQRAVAQLQGPDTTQRYHDALYSAGPIDPSIGLLELAVDYGAQLWVEAHNDNSIALFADLALERTQA